jgi:hypothetical protein
MYRNINLEKPLSEASSYISKEKILQLVSEYQIFAFYLGYDFSLGKALNSPLRKDSNPSFAVFKAGTTIKFRDYGIGITGDVFDFVSRMFGLTFTQSLLKIALDFNLPLNNLDSNNLPSYTHIRGFISKKVNVIQSTKEIRIKKRDWKICDKDYWSSYHITKDILRFYNVIPVETAVINDVIVYRHNDKSPCYAYLFYKDNKYTYKLYQPFDKKNKWKSNIDKSVLQGWEQMNITGDILIITKSLKDVMVLKMLGLDSLAMQNEISSIKLSVMTELRSRFNRIYLFQDYDRAGIIGTYKLTRIYKFLKWFFIQDKSNNTNGLKDISDYIKSEGKQNTINLLYKKLIEWK